MNKNPLVSIIVPVYNVEKYLKQCMDTVLGQTYLNLDIVLVDDGSSDKSPKMCDDYAKKDSRVQVLHKENGGLISAWMAGVKSAKGQYLVFVDSDDWIELNMVEELVKHARGDSGEIVCSNYIIEKTDKQQSIKVKQSIRPGSYSSKTLETVLRPQLLGLEERSIHASRCMKLISKNLLEQNMQYMNEKVTMGEDLSIMFPVMLDATRIVVLEEGYFYHYRLVDSSMAHKYNSNLYEKITLLYHSLQQTIEKKIGDLKEREIFLQGLRKEDVFLLFLVMKNELRGPEKNMVQRIQGILEQAKKEHDLKNVRVEVRGKANQLLYYIWKRPTWFRISLGKIAIKIFDRI